MGLRARLLCLISLCFASPSWGSDTTWDLRLRFSPSHPDAISPGVQYEGVLSDPLVFTGAAQFAFSPREVRHLAYQAGLALSLFPVLRAETTLFHLVLPAAGAGWSGLTGRIAFDIPIGRAGVYGAFGWYERLSRASGAGVLPFAGSRAEREHDFLFRLGTRVRVSERWAGSLEAASFDSYEIYNLNGPFLQAAVEHEREPGESWRAYARYQMLLGFGRLSEFIVGAEVRLYRL